MFTSVKRTTIVGLCLGFALLFCIFICVNAYLLNSTFDSFEQKLLIDDIERVKNLFDAEIAKLDAAVADWAIWDDSVDFMQRKTKTYIKSNLNDKALGLMELSFIVYINNSNEVFFSKSKINSDKYSRSIPAELASLLFGKMDMSTKCSVGNKINGLVYFQDKLTVVSSSPILSSEEDGPKAGVLVMGRTISNEYLEKLSKNNRIKFTIGYKSSAVAQDFDKLKLISTIESGNGSVSVYDLNSDEMAGIVLLEDILRQKTIQLIVYNDKGILNHGYLILMKSSIVLLAGGAVLLFLIIVFVDRSIIKRIVSLKEQLARISEKYASNEGLETVSIPGADELHLLSEQLNFYINESYRYKQKLEMLVVDLEALASTDPLTNTNNRRRFFDIMHNELERAKRYKRSFALLVIDIDNFKGINDAYGHPVGDSAIIYVSNILKKTLRKVDTLGRIGGEEFGVIVPELEQVNLGELLRRLVDAFDKHVFTVESCSIKITVSIGVALFPKSANDLAGLLKYSDQAMYIAKRNGKNQFCLYDG